MLRPSIESLINVASALSDSPSVEPRHLVLAGSLLDPRAVERALRDEGYEPRIGPLLSRARRAYGAGGPNRPLGARAQELVRRVAGRGGAPKGDAGPRQEAVAELLQAAMREADVAALLERAAVRRTGAGSEASSLRAMLEAWRDICLLRARVYSDATPNARSAEADAREAALLRALKQAPAVGGAKAALRDLLGPGARLDASEARALGIIASHHLYLVPATGSGGLTKGLVARSFGGYPGTLPAVLRILGRFEAEGLTIDTTADPSSPETRRFLALSSAAESRLVEHLDRSPITSAEAADIALRLGDDAFEIVGFDGDLVGEPELPDGHDPSRPPPDEPRGDDSDDDAPDLIDNLDEDGDPEGDGR